MIITKSKLNCADGNVNSSVFKKYTHFWEQCPPQRFTWIYAYTLIFKSDEENPRKYFLYADSTKGVYLHVNRSPRLVQIPRRPEQIFLLGQPTSHVNTSPTRIPFPDIYNSTKRPEASTMRRSEPNATGAMTVAMKWVSIFSGKDYLADDVLTRCRRVPCREVSFVMALDVVGERRCGWTLRRNKGRTVY